jgi:hypothetical protein
MPYTTSDKYPDVVQMMYTSFARHTPLFPMFSSIRMEMAASLRDVADKPIGFPSGTWDGAADVTNEAIAASHVLSITPALRKKVVTIAWRDAQLDPSIVSRKASELVDMYNRYVDSLAAAGLAAGFSGLTVPDGAGSTTAALSAGHTLADASTQDNTLALALSPYSLGAARARISGWKDFQGNPLGLAGRRLALVVPTGLGDYARTIVKAASTSVGAAAPVGSSTGITIVDQYNPFGDFVVVVENPYLSDTNDWYLIPMEGSPFVMWLETPVFRAIDNLENGATKLILECNAKAYWRAPTHSVAIGSTLA